MISSLFEDWGCFMNHENLISLWLYLESISWCIKRGDGLWNANYENYKNYESVDMPMHQSFIVTFHHRVCNGLGSLMRVLWDVMCDEGCTQKLEWKKVILFTIRYSLSTSHFMLFLSHTCLSIFASISTSHWKSDGCWMLEVGR